VVVTSSNAYFAWFDSGLGAQKNITVPSATYSATALAAKMQELLIAAGGTWTVNYNTSTRIMTVTRTDGATFDRCTVAGSIYSSIGFSSTGLTCGSNPKTTDNGSSQVPLS
jgi:hypothetical protein